MGLDGGTTMTRSDVLRGSSWRVANQDNTRSTRGGSISQSGPAYKEETVSREDAASIAFTTCSLSDEPLMEPIVADYLGRLYNRDAVLEFLLAKRKDHFVDGATGLHRLANTLRVAGGSLDNLTCMKDVFSVTLKVGNKDGSKLGSVPDRQRPGGVADRSCDKKHPGSGSAGSVTPYECPITQLPCTRYQFSALPSCGHIISDRALNSIKEQTCPVCEVPYEETISINPTKEQLQQLKSRMLARAAHKSKSSKRKRQKTMAASSGSLKEADSPPRLLLEGPKM